MIRKMQKTDISACAEILCAVYNNEMWQCHWTMETGTAYLEDYFEAKKFGGFVIEEDAFWNSIRNRNWIDVRNDLHVGTDTEGGYLVPDEFERKLIEALMDG